MLAPPGAEAGRIEARQRHLGAEAGQPVWMAGKQIAIRQRQGPRNGRVEAAPDGGELNRSLLAHTRRGEGGVEHDVREQPDGRRNVAGDDVEAEPEGVRTDIRRELRAERLQLAIDAFPVTRSRAAPQRSRHQLRDARVRARLVRAPAREVDADRDRRRAGTLADHERGTVAERDGLRRPVAASRRLSARRWRKRGVGQRRWWRGDCRAYGGKGGVAVQGRRIRRGVLVEREPVDGQIAAGGIPHLLRRHLTQRGQPGAQRAITSAGLGLCKRPDLTERARQIQNRATLDRVLGGLELR